MHTRSSGERPADLLWELLGFVTITNLRVCLF
jgi:hypothetical protein